MGNSHLIFSIAVLAVLLLAEAHASLDTLSAEIESAGRAGLPHEKLDDLYSEASSLFFKGKVNESVSKEQEAQALLRGINALSDRIGKDAESLRAADARIGNTTALSEELNIARADFRIEDFQSAGAALDMFEGEFASITTPIFAGRSIYLSDWERETTPPPKVKGLLRDMLEKARNANDLASLDSFETVLAQANDSWNSLQKIEGYADEARQREWNYSMLSDYLKDANSYYGTAAFGEVSPLEKSSRALLARMSSFHQQRDSLASRIAVLERQTGQIASEGQQLQAADSAFTLGRLDEAEEILGLAARNLDRTEQASLILGAIRPGSGAGKILGFVERHWIWALAFMLVLFVSIAAARKPVLLRMIKMRMRRLAKEEDSLKSRLKEIQRKYYVEKSISDDSYRRLSRGTEKRLLIVRMEALLKMKEQEKYAKD